MKKLIPPAGIELEPTGHESDALAMLPPQHLEIKWLFSHFATHDLQFGHHACVKTITNFSAIWK
jgi:hypothetical protein